MEGRQLSRNLQTSDPTSPLLGGRPEVEIGKDFGADTDVQVDVEADVDVDANVGVDKEADTDVDVDMDAIGRVAWLCFLA